MGARSLSVALAVLAVGAAPAGAATLTVTTTADSLAAGQCSLRKAVQAVDAPGTAIPDCGTASAVGNTIVLGPQTYTLSIAPSGADDSSTGDLNLTSSVAALTITGDGPGTTTIDATGLGDRILDVTAGAGVTVHGLTLRGGHAPDGADGARGGVSPATPGLPGASGGAITNAGTLTLDDAAVTGNSAGNGGAGGGGGGSSPFDGGATGGNGGLGGGIFNTGTLALTGVTVTGNRSGNGGFGGFGVPGSTGAGSGANGGCCGDGGGLASAGGSVTVTASTISENIAGDGGSAGGGGSPFTSGAAGNGGTGAGGSSGGGIAVSGGSLTITNSTIAANLTGTGGNGGNGGIGLGPPPMTDGTGGGAGNGSAGGGIFVRGGATVALSNVTVALGHVGGPGNPGHGGVGGTMAGPAGAAAFDGGIYVSGTPGARLTNTLVADNALGNCAGAITDGGHNLSDATCPFATGNAALGSLQDNGGPTPTIALQAGSAAIDQGAGCPPTDQRGVARPSGAACDIGAYEVTPPAVAVSTASPITTGAATLHGTVTPNAGAASVHFEYGPTAAYGAGTTTQVVGGLQPSAFSAQLSGLRPGTLYHFRLVATSSDGTGASGDATFTTPAAPPPPSAPHLTGVRLAPSAFLAAPAGRRATGTTVSYTDSLAAQTTVVIFRAVTGIRHGRQCVKPTRGAHGKPCTRLQRVGSVRHADRAGGNRWHFTGRLGPGKLAPGSYRAQLTPRSGGRTGTTITISFRINPPPRRTK